VILLFDMSRVDRIGILIFVITLFILLSLIVYNTNKIYNKHNPTIISNLENNRMNAETYLGNKFAIESILPNSYSFDRLPITKNRMELIQRIKIDVLKNKILVIDGQSGVGKTFLAWRTARHLYKNDGIIPIWINSQTDFRVVESFYGIIKAFNQDFLKDNSDLTIENLVQLYFSVINKNILLIFDNVDSEESIKQFLDLIPENAFVIITTKDNNLYRKLNAKTKYSLKPFSNFEANEYLDLRFEDKKIESFYKKNYIDSVGRLPISLETSYSFFENGKYETVEEFLNSKSDKSIYDFAFDWLISNNNKSWEILQYASHLNTESINIDLFIPLLNLKKESLIDALNLLEELNLIKRNFQRGIHTISMQGMIKDSVLNYIYNNPKISIDKNIIIENLVNLISQKLPPFESGKSYVETIINTRKYYDHLIKLIEFSDEYKNSRVINQINDFKTSLFHLKGFYFFNIGEVDKPEYFYDQILKINPRDMVAWHMKARIASFNNDYEKFITYAKNSYNISKNILSEDRKHHFALKNVALDYMLRGDISRAIEYTNFDIIYNKSISSMNQKAYLLIKQGKIDESYEVLRAAKKNLKEAEKNASLAQGYNPKSENCYLLGLYYLRKENYERAIDKFKKSIDYDKINEDSYYRIAKIYRKNGNLDLAKNYINKTLNFNIYNPFYIVEKSLIEIELGNIDKAKDLYSTIKLSPNIENYGLMYNIHYYNIYTKEELEELKNNVKEISKIVEYTE
jgi:tetratricopeptide (TPR) repeat protein